MTYCFWSVSAAVTVLLTFFNFLTKPLKLISSNHTWLTYGSGNLFWHPFRWPWVKVTKLPKRNAIYIVPTVKWEPLLQSLDRYIPLIMLSTWLHFGEILPKFVFLSNFTLNPFSPGEHSICHILVKVGPIDVKQKRNESIGCYAD